MQEMILDSIEEENVYGIIIPEDEIEEDYEPSEREITNYAIQLGMDPKEDRQFFYIAKEGLKAPIPKPWIACKTKEENIFYFNTETEESQWEHPLDQYYKAKFAELKKQNKNRNGNIKENKNNLSKGILESENESEREDVYTNKNEGLMGTLNLSGIRPSNTENDSKPNFSQRSNILSDDDEFPHSLQKSASQTNLNKKEIYQQAKQNNDIIPRDYTQENIQNYKSNDSHINPQNYRSRPMEGNNYEAGIYLDTEGAIQKTEGELERTHGESTLKEIEIQSIYAFQKYEEDLNTQFNYVISQFEQNYQNNAAKIEEKYQKEINKFEQTLEKEKQSPLSSLEVEMKNFETKAREEYEEDLKEQIFDLNNQYELKRNKMEKQAEAEIQQCLQEVRKKWRIEIKAISKEVVHRKTKSFSTNIDLISEKFENRRSSMEEKHEWRDTGHNLKLFELEIQAVKEFEKDISKVAQDIQRKLECGIKDIESNRQKLKEEYNERQKSLKKEFRVKLLEEKKKIEEEYMNSLKGVEIQNNKKTLLQKGYRIGNNNNREKYTNREDDFNKQNFQKIELQQLEVAIANKEASILEFKEKHKKIKATELEVQEKECQIREMEKEIKKIVEESKKNQDIIKVKHLERNNGKSQLSKNQILNQIQELHVKLDQVEKEIEIHKSISDKNKEMNKQIDIKNMKTSSTDLEKLFKGVQEIKQLAQFKATKFGSAEKKRRQNYSIDFLNKTIEYGKFSPINKYHSREEPSTEKIKRYYVPDSLTPVKETKKRTSPLKKTYEKIKQRESKLEDRIKQIAPVTQSNNFDTPPKNEFGWKIFIEAEKKRISQFSKTTQFKKLEIRKVQDKLTKEHEDYKLEYASYKTDPKRTYTKKVLLENQKKLLNDKIAEYNRILCYVREHENILASKRDILNNIETTFEQGRRIQDLDTDTLLYLYRIYKNIQLDDFSLPNELEHILTSPEKKNTTINNESLESQAKNPNTPPQTYYKRWQILKEMEKAQWIKDGLKKINL